jgi:hypothetical protein
MAEHGTIERDVQEPELVATEERPVPELCTI